MKTIWRFAEEITQGVAERHGVPVEFILGRGRGKFVVRARHEAMALCYEFGYSTIDLGRYFKRDHTTILHAIRKKEKANALKNDENSNIVSPG